MQKFDILIIAIFDRTIIIDPKKLSSESLVAVELLWFEHLTFNVWGGARCFTNKGNDDALDEALLELFCTLMYVLEHISDKTLSRDDFELILF